jgi:hypothetical protein
MQRCSTRVVSNGCGLSMWLPLGMCLLVAVCPWRIPAHASGTRGLCKLARLCMLPGKGARGMRMLTYYLFLERGLTQQLLVEGIGDVGCRSQEAARVGCVGQKQPSQRHLDHSVFSLSCWRGSCLTTARLDARTTDDAAFLVWGLMEESRHAEREPLLCLRLSSHLRRDD